jgi:tetratricopeptide (TPR) repeat protein
MPARLILTALSILLLLSFPSLDACSKLSPEAKKETHRQRGLAYFEKGQYQEAVIELKNVIQIDPKDADGHYRLALAFLKLGGLPNLQAAYGELIKTVELNASNQDAQLKLGELYLVSQQPAKAREHAEVVLASAPQNTQGLILHGQSLISEKDFEKGIAELKKAIELDPKHIPTYITLAQAYLQMKDLAGTEATLVQAQQADPQSSEARAAMGDFRLLTGKPDQAEAEYKKALELAPDRDVLYLKLAGFYQATGKYEQAESMYQRLVALKPKEDKPHLYLGDYYSFIGQGEKALSNYQQAAELNPASIPARDKLIDHYLDLGRVEEADKLIQPILEKNKKDTAARFFDARVRLARGHTDEAIDRLQHLIKDEPQLAAAHHYLGLAFMQKDDLPQARRELTESVKLAPNITENRSALAGLHLAEGSYELAIEQAQAAIRLNGRNLQAATILGDAFLGKGDLTRAKQTFETISKALPKESYSRYRLGLIAQNEKNYAAALTYFEESLAANPHIIEPLTQIATIKVSQGKAKEARERVLRQLDSSPKNALIHNVLGKLWIQAKDAAQAEAAFKQAIELMPDLPVSYMNLGELYLATGKQEEAAKEYAAALAKNPRLVGAHMVLGMLHEQRKEYDKAKARYEEVLKLNPKFAPAANNLAWILSEESGSIDTIDRALGYAQTAYQLLPNDPNTADTLGWLYYKKTAYLKATNLLKEAAEKLPDNPVVQYHYGMAQHKNGDKAGAKKSLQTSLKLSQTFRGAEEAKKVLNEL